MHTACFVRDHSIPPKVNTPRAIILGELLRAQLSTMGKKMWSPTHPIKFGIHVTYTDHPTGPLSVPQAYQHKISGCLWWGFFGAKTNGNSHYYCNEIGSSTFRLGKAILIIIMAIVNVMSDHTHLSPIIQALDGSILWLVREKGRYRIYSIYKIMYLWCKLRFHLI